ncbi:MAG: NADH-quinone oxidoreductase subunit NuoF [Nitrospiraceae bacterium]|nr:NADH-quinone oxidoreductase subunit NuoF [Nitrospiraceae bacterium]
MENNGEKIEIKVCMGTGGIAAGGQEVLDAFKGLLGQAGIAARLDKNCASHKVGCRGFCSRDVLVDVIIDERRTTYQYIKPDMVARIVEEHIIGGSPVSEWEVQEDYHTFHDRQVKVVLSDCGEIDPEDIDAYIDGGGYGSARKALTTMTPEEIIEIVKKSGIRGRGGAGFPTGVKWEAARKQPPKTSQDKNLKYIICNADEGDPGAFMDRAVIEGNPHAVLEGMLVAAYAVGAEEGYIYIRAEYGLAIERLKIAIRQARERNLLGKNVLGTGLDFDVKVKAGAGAFVCGEETALIASIEGQRGMPRAKPPFPVVSGLWGRPTVINNVETLANIPYIIRRGADWFASLGTERSKGTKVFALTGKVRNTGLIEVPMGISMRDIIFSIGGGIEGGKKFKAVQTGGPSGGCIPEHLIDAKVCYENLVRLGAIVGSGSMIVLDEDDCMVHVAKYFLNFTQTESCGKCVPCRVGTKRLYEILDRITRGEGRESDLALLEKLSKDVKSASLCGLGQTAPNPVLSTLQYFRHEYEAHIFEKKCPAKACKALITYRIREEFCKGCGACMRVCPAGAISGRKKTPHTLNTAICIKCGSCFDICKFKAVTKE